jgi:hypothetical protein
VAQRGSEITPIKPLICWWAFLDTYRTLCFAPTPEVRQIFEKLRAGHFAYAQSEGEGSSNGRDCGRPAG